MNPPAPPSTPSDLPSDVESLQRMLKLHAWEAEHLPFAQARLSRSLYYALAQLLLTEQGSVCAPLALLKLDLQDPQVQAGLESFVRQGLINLQGTSLQAADAQVEMTPRLQALCQAHGRMLQALADEASEA